MRTVNDKLAGLVVDVRYEWKDYAYAGRIWSVLYAGSPDQRVALGFVSGNLTLHLDGGYNGNAWVNHQGMYFSNRVSAKVTTEGKLGIAVMPVMCADCGSTHGVKQIAWAPPTYDVHVRCCAKCRRGRLNALKIDCVAYKVLDILFGNDTGEPAGEAPVP